MRKKIKVLFGFIAIVMIFCPAMVKAQAPAPFILNIISDETSYEFASAYDNYYNFPPEHIDLLKGSDSYIHEFNRNTQTLTLYLAVPEYTVNSVRLIFKMAASEQTGQIPIPVEGTFTLNGHPVAIRSATEEDTTNFLHYEDHCYTLEIPVEALKKGKASGLAQWNGKEIQVKQSKGSITFDTDRNMDTLDDRVTYQVVVNHVEIPYIPWISGFIQMEDYNIEKGYWNYLPVGEKRTLAVNIYEPREDQFELVSVVSSNPKILEIKEQSFQKIEWENYLELLFEAEVLAPGTATVDAVVRANGKEYLNKASFTAVENFYPLTFYVSNNEYINDFGIYGQQGVTEPLEIVMRLPVHSQGEVAVDISVYSRDYKKDGDPAVREIHIGDQVFIMEQADAYHNDFEVHSSMFDLNTLNENGYPYLEGFIVVDMDGDFETTDDVVSKPLILYANYLPLENYIQIGSYGSFRDHNNYDRLAPQTTKDIPIFIWESGVLPGDTLTVEFSNLKSADPNVLETVDIIQGPDGSYRLTLKGNHPGKTTVSFDVTVNGYTAAITEVFTVDQSYTPEFMFKQLSFWGDQGLEADYTFDNNTDVIIFGIPGLSDVFEIGASGEYYISIMPTSITSSNPAVLEIVNNACVLHESGESILTFVFEYNGHTYEFNKKIIVAL